MNNIDKLLDNEFEKVLKDIAQPSSEMNCPAPTDPEIIFRQYDHQNILDLMAERRKYEGWRAERTFSDSLSVWDTLIPLITKHIQKEIEAYEQRYHIKFEEAGALLPGLKGDLKEPRQRTGDVHKLFE